MNEVQEKIFEYIDALALKLGVASEHVFELMIKQKIIEGIVYSSVIAVVGIIVWVATYKCLGYLIKNYQDLYEKDHELGWMLGSILLSVVSLSFLIVWVAALPQYILQIFNPEYYAIKEILEVFKGS
jgi:hypothetical protein